MLDQRTKNIWVFDSFLAEEQQNKHQWAFKCKSKCGQPSAFSSLSSAVLILAIITTQDITSERLQTSTGSHNQDVSQKFTFLALCFEGKNCLTWLVDVPPLKKSHLLEGVLCNRGMISLALSFHTDPFSHAHPNQSHVRCKTKKKKATCFFIHLHTQSSSAEAGYDSPHLATI